MQNTSLSTSVTQADNKHFNLIWLRPDLRQDDLAYNTKIRNKVGQWAQVVLPWLRKQTRI